MVDERSESEPSRELRLEGAVLVVACGVLIAALAGAFFAGRWVERRAQAQQVVTDGQPGPLAQVTQVEPPIDTSENLTFFDDLEGQEKQLEPARQQKQDPPAPATELARREPERPPSAAKPAPKAAGGNFYVQVFAGKDRKLAEGHVDRLQTAGYEVRMFSEGQGSGSLFKVRVGGYPTRDKARTMAVELQRAGYDGAFVATAG